MRTANPALNDRAFARAAAAAGAAGGTAPTFGPGTFAPARSETMTVGGAVNRTFILVGLLLMSAGWMWTRAETSLGWLMPAVFVGLGLAIVTVIRPTVAHITAPLYALAEGVVVGGVSAVYEAAYPGIVIQAAVATIATLLALLVAYRSGLIKATENFRLGVAAATGAIMLVYLASFVLGFFGREVPYLHDSGPLGIGISVVIVAVAALNLVLDFDFIERGAERGAPKRMEWYAGFGLLVTLVWLYLEMLRLLGKMRSRD